MATYRIFKFEAKEGRVLGPPIVVASDTDEQPVAQAQQLIDGAVVEVWQGKRLVQRFQPKS